MSYSGFEMAVVRLGRLGDIVDGIKDGRRWETGLCREAGENRGSGCGLRRRYGGRLGRAVVLDNGSFFVYR